MALGELLGIEIDRADDDGATVSMEVGDDHLNSAGTVHGGALATLVDVAMGMAVFQGTDEDERPVTVEMKVNYLEGGGRGKLTSTAKVRRRGNRFTVLEAEVEQDGQVIAFATGTYTTIES